METIGQDTSSKLRSEVQKHIQCPNCNSKRAWKDGLRHLNGSTIQRYLCRDCEFRFSESTANSQVKLHILGQVLEKPHPRKNFSDPDVTARDLSFEPFLKDLPFQRGEDIGSHGAHMVSITAKNLNTFRGYSSEHRVSASEAGAKNLVEVESRNEKQAAGATKLSPEDNKSKIIEFAWWLKKEGYAESTITRRVKILKTLIKRGANLLDTESVKLTLAKQEGWSSTTKEHAVTAYASFLKMHGGTWEPPRYRRVGKLPFIPTETEIDQLIASCNKRTSAFLQLLKETGMRCGEAWNLEWTDFDFENRSVRVTPEKGGDPRVLRISDKLVAMLKALPKDSLEPFKGSLRHFARTFRRQRKRAAFKLQNSRIEKITFHTLRHWKATMEYHRTKDILHVKELLGHKSIQNTLIYTHLVNFEDDQFTCRVARSLQEAKDLIEAGFDYVTEMEGVKLFRKRK